MCEVEGRGDIKETWLVSRTLLLCTVKVNYILRSARCEQQVSLALSRDEWKTLCGTICVSSLFAVFMNDKSD